MSSDDHRAVMEFAVAGYEILGAAGSGGMGHVYIARQLSLGRLVALKVLTNDGVGYSEERLARFRREAEIMASLSHPNVLQVYNYGEVGGHPYLILEYISQGDLRRQMPEGRPMPVDRVMAILAPIADALTYLHDRRVLHRDLKPENILMAEGRVPKVADFGVALSGGSSASLTKTGHRIGTMGYVAPEQHYQLDVDERADQFSLAALAYEMLTGQRPLGLFKPPSHHNPRLGAKADAVVLRGLQEDPRERYGTVLDFMEDLQARLKPDASKHQRGMFFLGVTALVAAVALNVYTNWGWIRKDTIDIPNPDALAAPPPVPVAKAPEIQAPPPPPRSRTRSPGDRRDGETTGPRAGHAAGRRRHAPAGRGAIDRIQGIDRDLFETDLGPTRGEAERDPRAVGRRLVQGRAPGRARGPGPVRCHLQGPRQPLRPRPQDDPGLHPGRGRAAVVRGGVRGKIAIPGGESRQALTIMPGDSPA